MRSLLLQLKKRRLALNLKQKDMMLRIGVSRQQYQHLESKGNPRLDTLELIAMGLKSEVMLVPVEKLDLIKKILSSDALYSSEFKSDVEQKNTGVSESPLADDPWKNILGDEE